MDQGTTEARDQSSVTQHSPLPWKVGERTQYVEIWGRMRMNHHPILASMEHEPREANASFIVKAVNNHDALVTALQDVIRDINDYERINNLAPNPGRSECWDSVARAKAALSAAGVTDQSSSNVSGEVNQ